MSDDSKRFSLGDPELDRQLDRLYDTLIDMLYDWWLRVGSQRTCQHGEVWPNCTVCGEQLSCYSIDPSTITSLGA